MTSTSLDTKNVHGAQSGTLLKGPKTNRQGDPLGGNYQMPGWSELQDSNNPYSVTKKENETMKKTGGGTTSAFAKSGAQQMGITSGAGNNPITGGLNDIPEHK